MHVFHLGVFLIYLLARWVAMSQTFLRCKEGHRLILVTPARRPKLELDRRLHDINRSRLCGLGWMCFEKFEHDAFLHQAVFDVLHQLLEMYIWAAGRWQAIQRLCSVVAEASGPPIGTRCLAVPPRLWAVFGDRFPL